MQIGGYAHIPWKHDAHIASIAVLPGVEITGGLQLVAAVGISEIAVEFDFEPVIAVACRQSFTVRGRLGGVFLRIFGFVERQVSHVMIVL